MGLGFGKTLAHDVRLSVEQAKLLDQDPLIRRADRATVAQNLLLANLNVVKEDSIVYFGDLHRIGACRARIQEPAQHRGH